MPTTNQRFLYDISAGATSFYYDDQFQTNNFTEEDIKNLVKTFKMEFPHGNINKRGTIEAIRKVFPRFERFSFSLNIEYFWSGMMPIV